MTVIEFSFFKTEPVDPVTENPESQQQQNEEMANGFLKNSENAPREGNNIINVSKNAQRDVNSSLGASRTSETAATTLLRSLAHPGRAYAEKATSVSKGTTGIPGRTAARSKRSSGNMDKKNGNADSTAICSSRASENRDCPAASRSLRSSRNSETAANSSVGVVNYTLSHANSLRVYGKKISHANSTGTLNVPAHSGSTSVVVEKGQEQDDSSCRIGEIAKNTEQRKASSLSSNRYSESDGDVIICGSKQNVRKLRGIKQAVSENNRSIHLKVNILHKGKPSSIRVDKRQGQQKFLTASPKTIRPRPSFTEAKQNRMGTNEDVTIVYSRIFLRMEEDTEEHMPDVVCIDDEEKEGDEITVRRPRIVEQDLHVSLTEVSPSLNRPSLNMSSSHSESSPLRFVSVLKNQKASGQKVLTGKALNKHGVGHFSRTSSERNVGMPQDESSDIWSRLGNPEQLLCDAATLLNK
jgi:hypothetical protein